MGAGHGHTGPRRHQDANDRASDQDANDRASDQDANDRASDQDATEPGLRSGRNRAGPPAVRPRRHRQARGWAR